MKKLNPLINELEKIYWQEMSLCNSVIFLLKAMEHCFSINFVVAK